MVYKKYIVRNGKVYGPYIYHSKRVKGKVVSEYRGPSKTRKFKFENHRNLFLILMGLFVLGVFAYVLVRGSGSGISGMGVLELDANYEEGKILEGNLNLALDPGELLPSSTKVVFENGGQVYRYDLSELVSDEVVFGNYYFNGKSFNESGYGYGVKGMKEVYPEVNFKLELVSTPAESAENAGAEIRSAEEGDVGEKEENATEEGEPEAAEKNEELSGAAEAGSSSKEETSDELSEQTPELSEQAEDVGVEGAGEELKSEESSGSSSSSEQRVSPITGAVVGVSEGFDKIEKFFSRFFSRLKLTGMVIEENSSREIIEAKLSKENPFVYELKEGQKAKLVSGSVRVGSESLQDDVLKLSINENKVVISTDYSIVEEGFGSEYSLGEPKEISINLSQLGLILEPGEVKVLLIYNDDKLASFSTRLGNTTGEEGSEELSKKKSNLGERDIEGGNSSSNLSNFSDLEKANESKENLGNGFENESAIVNESSGAQNESGSWNLSKDYPNLTSEEISILRNVYGNFSVKITKQEVFNGRLIVRYELGDNWVEHSYDYDENSTDLEKRELEQQMKKDEVKFLKDIAEKLRNFYFA